MKDCGIVKDLLPLVAEQLASEESTAFVKEHLKTCADCRAAFDAIQAPVEAEPAAPDPLAILVSEGIAEDVAQQIVVIFTESASLREAYNKLRSVFGNTAGRDYYQQVKDIASRQ